MESVLYMKLLLSGIIIIGKQGLEDWFINMK